MDTIRIVTCEMKEDHSMKLKSRDFKELISLVEEKLIEKSIKLSQH
jgi:hypothetical protein